MVSWSPSQSVTPCTNVPMPSVTIIEFMRKKMTKNPLMKPTAAPAASAATIAQPMGTPLRALSTASTVPARLSTLAIDKS